MTDPLIAIQVGAVSFADEGVTQVLDTFQDLARVNALFLATPTWVRGTGGRQLPGYALPDHGVQEHDPEFVGGSYTQSHAAYYGGTILPPVERAPELKDFDLLEAVIPEAKARGIASYAWMEESGYVQAVRNIPNFPKVLEVDVWNRPAHRPCFNNPDYRNWWFGVVEDYVKNYAIDGLAWCSERPGPLNTAIQIKVNAQALSCFCQHCKRKARESGIDPVRAQQGYLAILEWNQKVGTEDKPSDGAFTAFWRVLLQYPEVLAWQNLWTDSQRQMYRDIYGVSKASNRDVQVGWHVFHDISFSPFYRADQDYADLAKCSDFIKVVAYNNCAGPRFYSWINGISKTLFSDLTPAEVYPLMLKLLNLEEADLDKLPGVGFSADYVRRETERAVKGAGDGTLIYPGIDIDIPVGATPEAVADRKKRFENMTGVNNDATIMDGNLTACTRDSVKAAVLAAFQGGADGVVLSRKYSEMKLDNLAGVGDALQEIEGFSSEGAAVPARR